MGGQGFTLSHAEFVSWLMFTAEPAAGLAADSTD
jgi:hypothetical protein